MRNIEAREWSLWKSVYVNHLLKNLWRLKHPAIQNALFIKFHGEEKKSSVLLKGLKKPLEIPYIIGLQSELEG